MSCYTLIYLLSSVLYLKTGDIEVFMKWTLLSHVEAVFDFFENIGDNVKHNLNGKD